MMLLSRRKIFFNYIIIVVVFTITGFSSVLFSSFLLGSVLGLPGNFITGSWMYRIAYLVFIPPAYSIILVIVGTIFGRRKYFLNRAKRLWGRVIPLAWLK